MKKKRDMYAVSFTKLVDSAWMPQAEMQTFKGFRLRGSNDHIRIKTSANKNPPFEPISIQKFKNKEEFISYIVQDAIKVWDNYDAEKKFEKESKNIIADIDGGVDPKETDKWWDEDDEYIKDLYKHEPLGPDASEEEMAVRIKEIKERGFGKRGGWEPYLILREVCGVDLIVEPDIATEENVAEMRSNRPDPENNNGIVRRAVKRRGGVESESSNNR
jgi:hypothetical protein